ncbi:hypothetical protein [Jatrophihabitans sp. GAS493]|uniref:hypothetical protein n=1 Tax=Jatrophihabitans sp. GAS493 TaxID=1907575 RepID=UPI000BB85896|nr:hypothetical protein [Jatrophihabitans sp. GAS493]
MANSKQQPRRADPASRADRALHELVGGGRSQISVSKALRARDVNRPSEQDLADAEREMSIVRRNWRPD